MRRLLLSACALALCALSASFAVQPVPPVDVRGAAERLARADAPDAPKALKAEVATGPDGTTYKLVDREQLRVKAKGTRSLTVPRHLKGLYAAIPDAPAVYDWSKGRATKYPTLGNDQVGDCYYTTMCHAVQTWAGMTGPQVQFDAAKVISRYRKLSGGDNGLSDYDVFGQSHNGEFYTGVVGPNGPHKILDHLMIDPADAEAIRLAQWAFGGTVHTFALCNEWLSNIKPGAVWGKGRANRNAGHAVAGTGRNARGNWVIETWGIDPPIEVTQEGLLSGDPEVIVCFSMEWFDKDTGKAPNGMHYVQAAELWHTLGGRQMPPSPFPGPKPPEPAPPTPPVPPAPAPGTGFSGVLVYRDGVLVAVVPGGLPTPAGVEADLRAAGVSPAIIADVLKLLADIRAKAGKDVIFADLLKILLDFAGP